LQVLRVILLRFGIEGLLLSASDGFLDIRVISSRHSEFSQPYGWLLLRRWEADWGGFAVKLFLQKGVLCNTSRRNIYFCETALKFSTMREGMLQQLNAGQEAR
jgi:hypothetical protein